MQLALEQTQKGQYQSACATYQQGLEFLPNNAQLHKSLAYCLHQSGQFEQAEVHYLQACRLDSENAEAANHLGVLLCQQGREKEAITCFQTALKRNPNYAEAANNYGLACRALGKLDEAESQFRQALMINPEFVEAHYNLAGLLHETGEYEQAVTHCHCAINLDSKYGEAYNQLGIIFHDMGKFNEAKRAHEQALRLNPNDAEFNSNLAILLKEEGKFEHAEYLYMQAINIEPCFSTGYYNLGNLYREWGRFSESHRCFDKAIECEPDYADAHWNRANIALLEGNLEKGWQDYNWRHKTSLAKKLFPHNYPQPRWEGQPFAGQRLLVYCEQGLGDAIQFVRYLPRVKSLGGTVLLETWPALQSLFATASGIDELYVTQKEHPCSAQFDMAVSIMDLPYIFQTNLNTIPDNTPYLQADTEQVQQWHQRFNTNQLRVGLVWGGSPNHGNDKNRSVALRAFTEILGIPDVSFYSLQKGPAIEQLNLIQPQIRPIDIGTQFENFKDTAGAIAAMDLIISVDTAVAHLAGALNKQVWTLLPFVPDWRWMNHRSDSPWYPSMKLYRQPGIGDWDSVFVQLASDLRNMAR